MTLSMQVPATRAETVYAALKRAIIEGNLAPGQRLVIDEIARGSGVSTIPVREALRRLEAEGLVHNVPHVGVTVTQASPAELVGNYQILAVLSGLAARLAVANLSEADFAEIQEHIEAIDRCIREDRLREADTHNLALHDVINRSCGLDRLRCMIADLWHHSINRHRLFFGLVPGRAMAANEEHRGILAALQARDASAADRLMCEHLWHSADNFERFFREHPVATT
jgi:DNA-binding GntR family transcriptional regulator